MEWTSYRDFNEDPEIVRFRVSPDKEFIDIEYTHNPNQVYRYKRSVIGNALEEMILRAQQQTGLHTFINDHPEVRYGFTIVEFEDIES